MVWATLPQNHRGLSFGVTERMLPGQRSLSRGFPTPSIAEIVISGSLPRGKILSIPGRDLPSKNSPFFQEGGSEGVLKSEKTEAMLTLKRKALWGLYGQTEGEKEGQT